MSTTASSTGLTVYGSFLLYSGAMLVSSPILLIMQQYGILIPIAGDSVGFTGFCSGSWRAHGDLVFGHDFALEDALGSHGCCG
jgi:hypothetical protein